MKESNQNIRKLAAIMFTDIVGYSKLIQKDEDKALNILDEQIAIVRPILSQFNGPKSRILTFKLIF